MYILLLLTIFSAACGVLSTSISSRCKLKDTSCLEKLAKDLRPTLFAGSLEHGIKSSDPVFIEEILGNFPGFHYKLSNSSLYGYANCVKTNLKVNDDITKVQYDFNCPKLKMTGKYELTGHLLGAPAEGKGDYTYTGADAFHKFVHENWHEVTVFVQEPIWNICMGEVVKNVNSFLKNVPLNDFIIF